MSNDPRVLWYGFIGLGFGIYLFINGFRWFREKRLIENTPTSKIRSIAMGLVEIFGKVQPKKLIKSPLSNKDCVYYKYTIQEYRSSGKSNRWVTVKNGEKRTYFYLKDDTGTVLVDPKKSIIDIPQDFEFNSSLRKAPPETVKKFLRSQGLSFKSFLGLNKRMRFIEYFISPNDKLYIMGTADDNPFVEEATAQKSETDIMIHKGKSFYYISDKPEKEVLKSYKWKVIGGLFGGSTLIIFGLFVMFAYVGML